MVGAQPLPHNPRKQRENPAVAGSGERFRRGKWRRRWDSNPRGALTPTPLAGERLRPLGHVSVNAYSRASDGFTRQKFNHLAVCCEARQTPEMAWKRTAQHRMWERFGILPTLRKCLRRSEAGRSPAPAPSCRIVAVTVSVLASVKRSPSREEVELMTPLTLAAAETSPRNAERPMPQRAMGAPLACRSGHRPCHTTRLRPRAPASVASRPVRSQASARVSRRGGLR